MANYSDQIAQVSTALADPTRREIMQHVLNAENPISAREVAEHFGLHVNAARMHLDKLVKGGLLKVIRRRDSRGGRPAHLYHESDEERELLLPSRCYKALAEILLRGMSGLRENGPSLLHEEALRSGREEGLRNSSPLAYLSHDATAREVGEAWLEEAKRRGLKVRLMNETEAPRMVYLSCPFGEFSREYPELVCEIHHRLEEGLLSLAGEWLISPGKEDGICALTLEVPH